MELRAHLLDAKGRIACDMDKSKYEMTVHVYSSPSFQYACVASATPLSILKFTAHKCHIVIIVFLSFILQCPCAVHRKSHMFGFGPRPAVMIKSLSCKWWRLSRERVKTWRRKNGGRATMALSERKIRLLKGGHPYSMQVFCHSRKHALLLLPPSPLKHPPCLAPAQAQRKKKVGHTTQKAISSVPKYGDLRHPWKQIWLQCLRKLANIARLLCSSQRGI